MTASVVERSTAGEVATARNEILGLVDRTGGIALTDLLDELVLRERHRVEVVSRALTSLMTENLVELLPSRIVARARAADAVRAPR